MDARMLPALTQFFETVGGILHAAQHPGGGVDGFEVQMAYD
eukprot:SAG22_NODE_17695_length_300_cov_0.771144_1_plen_40_part_10